MNVGELHGDLIRRIERETITAFVERAGSEGYFRGRVLDYGCGQQPYRSIVERHGGEYHGYDRLAHPGCVADGDLFTGDPFAEPWDTILCTQVLCYVPDPVDFLHRFRRAADQLVLTAPTTWAEVESTDLYRWTQTGIEHVLREAGWKRIRVSERGRLPIPGWQITLGFGVMAS